MARSILKKNSGHKREQRNLVGQKFGKLLVIESCGKGKGNRYYSKVRCDCGKEYLVPDTSLITGRRTMCRHCNKPFLTHGLSGTKLHHTWLGMRERCNCPTYSDYSDYGGRGIKVCDEWNDDYTKFYEWALANGYKDYLTIERIDVNGNYEPSNCRWATWEEQARNKRRTVRLNYDGEYMTLNEIEKITGIKASTLLNRKKRGWSDYKTTHIKVGSSEAWENSCHNAIHKSVVLTDLKTNEKMFFNSCSSASRFMGFSTGYIANRCRKEQSNSFIYEGYLIEKE